ncbi:LysR family transcriptional regulator [Paracoccus aminovorans]|uniref:LysR family transcriptional regulator n=1 Tax=Paracoccus aminovorans TaxID=34004 RepID=UPI0007820754|nr:LysR family transcriptional regulator [Paracoccus aminovorans]MDQ7777302.1 LysR family transcriptional regulator [Paracoccus aminovorans]
MEPRSRQTIIELRHLRYVVAAVEHGSFSAAAGELGVRESAISRRIRDLEDETGAALFIRHKRGVTLTDAGRRFLKHARRALDELDLAIKDVGAAGRVEHGVLRIGIFASLASGFLAELLRRYNDDHPGVRSVIVEGCPANHIAAIRQHRMDVAFLTGTPDAAECDVEVFWQERVFVALPKEDDLTVRKRIAWSELRDRHFVVSEAGPGPEIHDYLVRHLSELGHHPSVERCPVSRDTLMQLVALGKGLTLTSEATTGATFPGVSFRPLATEPLPFCAVWSPRNDNPALRRLLSLARILSARDSKAK